MFTLVRVSLKSPLTPPSHTCCNVSVKDNVSLWKDLEGNLHAAMTHADAERCRSKGYTQQAFQWVPVRCEVHDPRTASEAERGPGPSGLKEPGTTTSTVRTRRRPRRLDRGPAPRFLIVLASLRRGAVSKMGCCTGKFYDESAGSAQEVRTLLPMRLWTDRGPT